MSRTHKVTEALRGHFRPEFLNRIDEIIIFDRLQREEITTIVDLQLDRVRKRLAKQGLASSQTRHPTSPARSAQPRRARWQVRGWRRDHRRRQRRTRRLP